MSARALGLAALLLITAGEAAAQDGCLSPELMVVLDTSGSMADTLPDQVTSRWRGALAAITSFATTYDGRFRFSLVTFPSGEQTPEEPCGDGLLLVRPGGTGDQLIDAVSQRNVFGGTPTAAALDDARQTLRSVEVERPRFAILITDGAPNCNPSLDPEACYCTCFGSIGCQCEQPLNCLDDERTYAAVRRLHDEGVRTFIVGFGGVPFPGVLDRMAQIGGTARPAASAYYRAEDQAELERALEEIVVASSTPTRPCETACGGGVEHCLADSWGACDGPQPGDLVPCVEVGCGGERLCTAGGFGPCEELPIGSELACEGPCGAGRGVCTGPGEISGCSAAAVGDLRRCKGDEAFCGGGDQICTIDGWSPCDAPRLGDVRTCPGAEGTCADQQTCERQGWTPCATARVGETIACTAPCGAGARSCQADGTFGACVATELGLLRSCRLDEPSCEAGVQECLANGWSACEAPVFGDREACEGVCGPGERVCLGADWGDCETQSRTCFDGCEHGGQQVCNDDGWSECFCFEEPSFLEDDGCGCGATRGSPAGLLALLVGATLLRRRAVR